MKISPLPVIVLCLAGSAMAADQVRGTASMNAEKVTFAHGVGTWNAPDREATIGFFVAPPGATPQPFLVVELTFKEGTKKASVEALSGCHMGWREFKDSPLDRGGFASDCGITELTGDLAGGGVLTGKMKNTYDFPAMGSMKAKATAWDLAFTSTLRASDASVEMEAAVGPKAVALGPGGGAPGKAFLEEKCKGGGLLGMQDCKILGGREDGKVAILKVEANTMGSRMRNDFTLVKEGAKWKVQSEGAWRSLP